MGSILRYTGNNNNKNSKKGDGKVKEVFQLTKNSIEDPEIKMHVRVTKKKILQNIKVVKQNKNSESFTGVPSKGKRYENERKMITMEERNGDLANE